MKKLRAWFATPGGRQFFNIIYSLGAAVVIIGALFKIIHVRGGDIIFIIGMSIEAFIFFLSAFDTSYTDSSSPATGSTGGYIINANDAKPTSQLINSTSVNSDKVVTPATGGGTPSIIVVGGGDSSAKVVSPGSNTLKEEAIKNNASPVSTFNGNRNQYVGGDTVSGSSHTGEVTNGDIISKDNNIGATSTSSVRMEKVDIPAEEYAHSAASAAQNLEDFSQTMKSLNETSQTILQAYKEIAETQNLGDTMNTLRYINDSLTRIKSLYDGAIGDSYMFKEEMSKMTRHIEALNQVYARLLQAMTMNNPNNNNFPHNPPY